MKIVDLKNMIDAGRAYGHSNHCLPRYAAMCGVDLPKALVEYCHSDESAAVDIPADKVQQILALDFAERASADLRAMGEGIGKINVSLPSNINVWQHLKGESSLRSAAESLTAAAKLIAQKATE
jgi:hypothetical protein